MIKKIEGAIREDWSGYAPEKVPYHQSSWL